MTEWCEPIKCLLCKHEHSNSNLYNLSCAYKMGWHSSPYYCDCVNYIKTNLDLIEYLANKKKLV